MSKISTVWQNGQKMTDVAKKTNDALTAYQKLAQEWQKDLKASQEALKAMEGSRDALEVVVDLEESEEAVKGLSAFDEMMATTRVFAGVAAALGAAGAVFSLASFITSLFSGPSVNQIILEQLAKISQQVRNLREALDAGLQELKNELNLDVSKLELFGADVVLATVEQDLQALTHASADDPEAARDAADSLKSRVNKIEDALTRIAIGVRKGENPLALSVVENVFKSSYGDLRPTVALIQYLLHAVDTLTKAYAIARHLETRGSDFDASHLDERGLDEILGEAAGYADDIVHRTSRDGETLMETIAGLTAKYRERNVSEAPDRARQFFDAKIKPRLKTPAQPPNLNVRETEHAFDPIAKFVYQELSNRYIGQRWMALAFLPIDLHKDESAVMSATEGVWTVPHGELPDFEGNLVVHFREFAKGGEDGTRFDLPADTIALLAKAAETTNTFVEQHRTRRNAGGFIDGPIPGALLAEAAANPTISRDDGAPGRTFFWCGRSAFSVAHSFEPKQASVLASTSVTTADQILGGFGISQVWTRGFVCLS